MSVTFCHAKTEVVEIEPAKVVLEMTPEEAGYIRALLGVTHEDFKPTNSIYESLTTLAHSGKIPYYWASRTAGPVTFEN